jgi:putative DNA primase/helicase
MSQQPGDVEETKNRLFEKVEKATGIDRKTLFDEYEKFEKDVKEKRENVDRYPSKGIKRKKEKEGREMVSNNDPWWSIPKGSGKKEFIPPELAKFLMERYHLIYDKSDYFYYEDGYFKGEGEAFLKRIIKSHLGNDYRESRAREVLSSIRAELEANYKKKIIESTDLINLINGMLDWERKKLLPHDPKYKSNIRIPVEYNPNAKCPAFEKFISKIFPDTQEIHKLVYEMIGYCFIPTSKMETWFILHDVKGTGCNGKSTLLNVLKTLLGKDNYSTETLQELEKNRFRMANLYGKLANIHPDISPEGIKHTGILKALVSGEEQSAERKNKDPFSFANNARLFFSCNQIPRSRDTTGAYYRRLIIIPFNRCFENSKDENLKSKLTTPEELSGIFNLAIDGLKRLMRNGKFTETPQIKKELANYKRQNETIYQFIEDKCILDTQSRIGKTALYEAYVKWCKDNDCNSIEKKKFDDTIKKQYGKTCRVAKMDGISRRVWFEIDLVSESRSNKMKV